MENTAKEEKTIRNRITEMIHTAEPLSELAGRILAFWHSNMAVLMGNIDHNGVIHIWEKNGKIHIEAGNVFNKTEDGPVAKIRIVMDISEKSRNAIFIAEDDPAWKKELRFLIDGTVSFMNRDFDFHISPAPYPMTRFEKRFNSGEYFVTDAEGRRIAWWHGAVDKILLDDSSDTFGLVDPAVVDLLV